MTSMREDVHDEWGRKCFGAAVISSPVWNYFDVSRNNEIFAVYVPNKSHVEAHCPKHLIQ